MNKQHFQDKWNGMRLLSAYGDALGAAHEMAALSGDGAVRDPNQHTTLPKGSDFSSDRFEDPWAIWISQDDVKNRSGIVTDDTAFRLGLLHPWLSHLKTPIAKTILQSGFDSFFRDFLLHPFPHKSMEKSRARQLMDWQEMYQTATRIPPQSALFYQPDVPTSFGLFQCLDIAAFFAEKTTKEIFLCFKTLNPLDQAYGKLLTGLVAVLIAKGMPKSVNQQQFQQQFPTIVAEIFAEIQPLISPSEQADWALILNMTDQAKEFAQVTHASDYEFLETFRQQIFLDPTLAHFHQSIRNNHDPLLFWMQLFSALTYSQFQVIPTLQLLASSAGDSDTLAALGGALVGAWLGLEELEALENGSVQLRNELGIVSDTLDFMFGEHLADSLQFQLQL